MSEVKNIPRLRFHGFFGDWRNKRLDEISEFRRGSFPQPYGLPEWYDDVNGSPFVQVYDVDDNFKLKPDTKQKISVIAQPKSVFVPKGSVIITIQGSIGRVAITQYDSFVDRTLLIFTTLTDQLNKWFFSYQLDLLFENEKRIAPGGTIKTITKEVLSAFSIGLPSLPEQQKIADFLTAVDKRIELLEKKKTLLETYKKGVMKKIFNQEIRFKDDNGKEFPDWEEKRLGDVSECLDNQRKPLNDSERQNMKGDIPYWGANNIMDYINEYIFNEPIVLLAEDGGNFNDFKDRPIANYYSKKCWVNNHTHVLKGKKDLLDTKFLFFSVVHKNIIGFVSGGTRSKLTKSEMLKIPLGLPCVMEQKRISEFLSSIDNQIELLETQIYKSQTWKKGLLQKMFV